MLPLINSNSPPKLFLHPHHSFRWEEKEDEIQLFGNEREEKLDEEEDEKRQEAEERLESKAVFTLCSLVLSGRSDGGAKKEEEEIGVDNEEVVINRGKRTFYLHRNSFRGRKSFNRVGGEILSDDDDVLKINDPENNDDDVVDEDDVDDVDDDERCKHLLDILDSMKDEPDFFLKTFVLLQILTHGPSDLCGSESRKDNGGGRGGVGVGGVGGEGRVSITPKALLEKFDVEEAKVLARLVALLVHCDASSQKMDYEECDGSDKDEHHTSDVGWAEDVFIALNMKGSKKNVGGKTMSTTTAATKPKMNEASPSALVAAELGGEGGGGKGEGVAVDAIVQLEWLTEKAEFLIRLRNLFRSEKSIHFEIYRMFVERCWSRID